MLHRVRALSGGPEESRGGFAEDIRSLRVRAAFSVDKETRLSASTRLHDLDSAIFVIENSGFEDARERARRALDYRLGSFTDEVLAHLSSVTDSATLREAASRILSGRAGQK